MDINLDAFLHPESPTGVDDSDLLIPSGIEDSNLLRTSGVRTVQGPPFDFSWKWFHEGGSPPVAQELDPPSGTLHMKGQCGVLTPAGAGGRFVEGHAGYGLFFRPDRDGVLVGQSSRRFLKFAYSLGAQSPPFSPVPPWALTEGGTEFTVLEDGQWKAGFGRQRWRKRVSVNEQDQFESNLFGDGPARVEHPVRAGAGYTFNVGIWFLVDNASNVGASGAIAAVAGEIPVMEVMGP